MKKKPKQPHGRPKTTDDLVDLLATRAFYEAEIPFRSLAPMFGLTKSVAHAKVQKITNDNPDFARFLKELGGAQSLTVSREEMVAEVFNREEVRTVATLNERIQEIRANLANELEITISTLLDMQPAELRAMKTEHKLRHIPELIKAMRLLREQSTENVAKLSLIKAVGIATARRNATD